MSSLPPLPPGISRDDTQHGRIYYTLAQMRDYGKACAKFAMSDVLDSRARHNASGQAPKSEYSKAFHDLFSTFGMKE